MCRTIVGQPYFIVGRMSYSFFQTPLFIVFFYMSDNRPTKSDKCLTDVLQ